MRATRLRAATARELAVERSRECLQGLRVVQLPAPLTHLLQGGHQRVKGRLRERLRGAVGFEQLQDGGFPQVGAAWQARQKADERGKEHDQLVLQPLAGGSAGLDEIPSGARQRAERLHGRGGPSAGPGQAGQQPTRQCLRIQPVGRQCVRLSCWPTRRFAAGSRSSTVYPAWMRRS
jgi:hypothetical protein